MRWVKLWWKELCLGLVAMLAIALSVAMVFSTLQLDLRAMEIRLRTLEREGADDHGRWLVERFARQYALYAGSISLEESDRREWQDRIVDAVRVPDKVDIWQPSGWDAVNLRAQNALRRLLGRHPLLLDDEGRAEARFDSAYVWERERRYAKAMAAYRLLRGDSSLGSLAMLHEGYLLGLAGRFGAADSLLLRVMVDNAGRPVARHAQNLRDIVVRFSLAKSQAVNLKDHGGGDWKWSPGDCMRNSSDVGNEGHDRHLYRQGRCLEYQGAVDSAAVAYTAVLEVSKDRKLLSAANRRLYMLGAGPAPEDQASRHRAEVVDEVLRDPVLADMRLIWSKVENSANSRERVDRKAYGPSVENGHADSLAQKLRTRLGEVAKPAETRAYHPVATIVAEQESPAPAVVPEEAPSEPPPPAAVYAAGTQVTVRMQDGKRYTGKLLTASNAATVQFQTAHWIMGFSQDEIAKIEPANP